MAPDLQTGSTYIVPATEHTFFVPVPVSFTITVFIHSVSGLYGFNFLCYLWCALVKYGDRIFFGGVVPIRHVFLPALPFYDINTFLSFI